MRYMRRRRLHPVISLIDKFIAFLTMRQQIFLSCLPVKLLMMSCQVFYRTPKFKKCVECVLSAESSSNNDLLSIAFICLEKPWFVHFMRLELRLRILRMLFFVCLIFLERKLASLDVFHHHAMIVNYL